MLAPILAPMLAIALASVHASVRGLTALALLAALFPALPLLAEESPFRGAEPRTTRGGGTPMSAIDWLNSLSPAAIAAPTVKTLPRPTETPVASSATIPLIDTRPLGAQQSGAVGLLPASVTGLPDTLWLSSRSADVVRALRSLDVAGLPAMQSLLYTLLLAEVDPPADAATSDLLLRARLSKLRDLGAIDPALALVERAGPTRDPGLFAAWFDLSLLAGSERDACLHMLAEPRLAPDPGARIFCLARDKQWDTASLLLDTGALLDTFDPVEQNLLNRFLHDDLDDTAVPLPPPANVTPLLFRLSEAIGEPLPTSSLPRAFAVSDLRGLTGWKAGLEAAERLARTGALPENRLLGIYSDGRPSASGGIWDRVQAVQAFDRAISGDYPDRAAVLATLPAAWDAMVTAELEEPFSRLYGAALVAYADAPGPAGRIAFKAALLGPGYETSAALLTPRDNTERFLIALAQGRPDRAAPYNAASGIVAAGFAPGAQPPERLRNQLSDGKLGEAILGAMRLYASAMTGELKDTSDALATFRRVGLEDTARRAGLQLLLLERRG